MPAWLLNTTLNIKNPSKLLLYTSTGGTTHSPSYMFPCSEEKVSIWYLNYVSNAPYRQMKLCYVNLQAAARLRSNRKGQLKGDPQQSTTPSTTTTYQTSSPRPTLYTRVDIKKPPTR
ncbi:hypothetical protein C2857_006952 [Epichloe festucae Fl1]|uniref:Uncharacterized protein n=1 Tax=Epichloe festucae (strain Fl1) TaxID=877507 RepID=A0A7S9KM42_EPIFF|nr:hypothetical protein C2857_006952 [Epichloe festucae Fl1]